MKEGVNLELPLYIDQNFLHTMERVFDNLPKCGGYHYYLLALYVCYPFCQNYTSCLFVLDACLKQLAHSYALNEV